MPACFSAWARSRDMCPIEAQRLRFVCSATSFAPSITFSKSRFERPWPCVTMQKRCAPAASAALARARGSARGSSSRASACGASAKRDWEQKPQSSAQPPDFALTSEHMSVESPKRSVSRLEGPLDERLDLRVVLDLAQGERFLVRDQRRQAIPPMGTGIDAEGRRALGRPDAWDFGCRGRSGRVKRESSCSQMGTSEKQPRSGTPHSRGRDAAPTGAQEDGRSALAERSLRRCPPS